MREKNKTAKWVITILMLFVTILILVSCLLPFLRIDLGEVFGLFPGDVKQLLNDVTEVLGGEEGKVVFSGVTLFRAWRKLSEEAIVGDILFSLLKIMAVIYAAVLLSGIFSLFRRVWSYILSLIFALAGIALTVLSVCIFIPSEIYHALPATVTTLVEALNIGFDQNYLRDLCIKGTGLGCWACAGGCLILLILAISGIVLAAKGKKITEEKPQPVDSIFDQWPPQEEEEEELGDHLWKKEALGQPNAFSDVPAAEESKTLKAPVRTWGVACGFGELNGVEIPLKAGESITIGSDRVRCNLVAPDPGIDSIHCRILYNAKGGCYEVTDLSSTGISINGMRMLPGKPISLIPGTILFLANQHALELL